MYVWCWRHLPGGTATRVLLSLLVFAGVVALLFFAVFPRLDELLPFGDVTVEGRAADGQGGPTTSMPTGTAAAPRR